MTMTVHNGKNSILSFVYIIKTNSNHLEKKPTLVTTIKIIFYVELLVVIILKNKIKIVHRK